MMLHFATSESKFYLITWQERQTHYLVGAIFVLLLSRIPTLNFPFYLDEKCIHPHLGYKKHSSGKKEKRRKAPILIPILLFQLENKDKTYPEQENLVITT